MRYNNIYINYLIILFSLILAVESETVNEKYRFIDDIYNESWALIIGINNYQNVPQLNYAVNDAVAVKEMLVANYGFKNDNIKLIIDEEATKDNILKGFSDILTQAKEKDRVIVFYAGHGETYKLPSGGDMGYLIPVDGNLENLYLSSIPMKSVYDIADMSYAKHILYLVDACYGGLTLATTRGLKKDITPEYIQKMTKERGRQVITAGGKGEQVLEKAEWGHSAFTKSLLNGLGEGYADENMDGIITADELGGFIKNRVVVDVNGSHTPQKGRIGSDMGEFVFISETLETQIASVDNGDENLDEIKQQMEAQQKQMAQLTELLLSKTQENQKFQQIKTDDTLPSLLNESNTSKKSFNRKNATVLSWVFPGMGHYYLGHRGKGLLFTSIGLLSIGGIIVSSSEYSTADKHYQVARSNIDTSDALPLNCDEMGHLDCYRYWKSEASRWLDSKNEAQAITIVSTAITSGIWIWNVLDVKNKALDFSYSSKYSVGINRYGQVQAQINF